MSNTKTKPNKKIEQWVEKGIFIIKGNFTGYQTELYSFAYEASFIMKSLPGNKPSK